MLLTFSLFFIAAPGGLIVQDGDNPCQTKTCLFGLEDADNMEGIQAWENVFLKITRR